MFVVCQLGAALFFSHAKAFRYITCTKAQANANAYWRKPMNHKWHQIILVAFTYMGTVVGAGFASGQEILQFFTLYGRYAAFTIVLSTFLFIWLGIKVMLLAKNVGASTYEDLNKVLFGPVIGRWISWFMMLILLGTSAVMLAGAGSLFEEQLHFSYQSGLIVTLFFAYLVLANGIQAIMHVNSFVVPLMIAFTIIVVWHTWHIPNHSGWLRMTSDFPYAQIWFSPILYAAFNLAGAQAVLVPLSSAIKDRSVLYWGGILGGIGIGLLLLSAHYALSAQMPGIQQYEIPMSHIIQRLGRSIQLMYTFVIFGEIFTTYIAGLYGLTLQLQPYTRLHPQVLLVLLLGFSYLVSQIGFSMLLSTLYPLFGCVSIIWFVMIVNKRNTFDPLHHS
jgi:uncharacterized membrane protein YkvI